MNVNLTKEYNLDTTKEIKEIQEQITKILIELEQTHNISEWQVILNKLRVSVFEK